jgi:hypothetical protein
MAKKQTALQKPVTLSLGTVLLFMLIFGLVGGYAIMKSFAEPTVGRGKNTAATIVVSKNPVKAGDMFDVSGCGYNPAYGNVIIGFTGGSWGGVLNASNCFVVAQIPALSGDTLPAGNYPVTGSQYIKGKLTKVSQTYIQVQ